MVDPGKTPYPKVLSSGSFSLNSHVLEGDAIDTKGTLRSHQLFSVYQDKYFNLPRLDYSLLTGSFPQNPQSILATEFSRMVTARFKNKQTYRKVHTQFRDVTSQITRDRSDDGFSSRVHDPALTFSFVFNPEKSCETEACFVSHTWVRLSKRTSFEKANEELENRSQNPKLRLWYDFMTQHDNTVRKCEKPDFQIVTEATSRFVQNTAKQWIMDGGPNCLFHHNLGENKDEITEIVASSDALIDEVREFNLPLTCGRRTRNQAPLNRALIFHFLKEEQNLFSPQIIQGFAALSQDSLTPPKGFSKR